MRVRFSSYGDVVDTQALVSQMDNTVAILRSAWDQVNSQWAIMLTTGQAQAADARIATLRSLIDDLDVGGVARQHVFFPLDGQTQDDAWSTWVDTANYVKTGLAQVGGFVSKWSVSAVLPRIVGDIGNTASNTLTGMLWLVGGVVAIQVLQLVGGARRSLSGYTRNRRRRR